MTTKGRLELIRALVSNQANEGFSLVELVVVIAVMAVLGAVALPSFLCVLPKARATAALAAMKQIQKECIIKKSFNEGEIFSDNNLQGYKISTNNCQGIGGNGVISAIPNDVNVAPTFILDTKKDELSYNFKGQIGTDFNTCLGMICDSSNNDRIFNEGYSEKIGKVKIYPPSSFQENLDRANAAGLTCESNAVIRKHPDSSRTSAYVAIKGKTWEEANSNAAKLGGHLVTINSKAENQFLVDNYHGSGKLSDKENSAWTGHNDKETEGSWVPTSEEEVNWSGGWAPGEPDGRSNYKSGEQYSVFGLIDNYNRDPGHWSDVPNDPGGINCGIAEIKLTD